MKSGNERTADLILAASFVLCLASVPVSDTAAGGFFFHTALAATVGGAADWFAVHSLFRKPLGIPFRTELIPKSRDKIIRMAREMMTKELFTPPRLYHMLKAHSPSAGAQIWLSEHRDEARALFACAANMWLASPAIKDLAEAGEETIETAIRREDWALLVSRTLCEKEKEILARPLFSSVGRATQDFLREALTDETVSGIYEKAWETYEKGGHGRAMLRSLLASQLGLTDEKAVSLIQEKAMQFAADFENPESAVSRKISEAYGNFAKRLAEDETFREKANQKISAAVLSFWKETGREISARNLNEKKEDAAGRIADAALSRLVETFENPETRRKIDRWILKQIFPLLPKVSEAVGDSAADALSAYSGRDMAEIAERGVWHDLQMIRINGSMIGALLGGVSYIAFYVTTGGGL